MKPFYSQHKVLSIALPMTFASISVPMLGIVDTAILGHLNAAKYIAAVAAGSSVLTMLFWLLSFLRTGTTSLTARALGAENPMRCMELLVQSLFLAILFGSTLVLLQRPILQWMLWLIEPSEQVYNLAMEYCRIRIMAAPATLGTLCAVGWLLGLQRIKATLLLMLFTNITNLLLDFFFIIGLELNSKGAAYASLTAEILGFFFALLLLRKNLLFNVDSNQLKSYWRNILVWHRYSELIQINRHLFIRTACVVFTMFFFTAQGARQSDAILAANTILMQMLLLIAFTQDGFAHAAETLVGHAVGRKDTNRFYQICIEVTVWGLGIAIFATAIYYFFPHTIIAIFTDLPTVSNNTLTYWPWLTALPLLGFLCFMADGIFIGSGKTQAMQNTMLLATFGIFLPCWFFSRHMGNHGLWLAYLSFLSARSLMMSGMFAYYSHQHRWLQ